MAGMPITEGQTGSDFLSQFSLRESRLKKEGKIWHEHELPRDYSNRSSSLHYSNVTGNDKETEKIVLYVDWLY